MRRYRCLREGTAVAPCHLLGPPPPTPVSPRPPPGQVAARPALQQDDLAAQRAEAPLDEEGAGVALQRERGQVVRTGSLALQRLVQLLLQEELGGSNAVRPPIRLPSLGAPRGRERPDTLAAFWGLVPW